MTVSSLVGSASRRPFVWSQVPSYRRAPGRQTSVSAKVLWVPVERNQVSTNSNLKGKPKSREPGPFFERGEQLSSASDEIRIPKRINEERDSLGHIRPAMKWNPAANIPKPTVLTNIKGPAQSAVPWDVGETLLIHYEH